MANILNAYNCLTAGGNTGPSACPVDIGTIVGAILLPTSKAFSAANLADSTTFLTALQAATLADATARVYPLKNLDQPNDASEANTYQTTAYGSRAKIRNGVYDLTYQVMIGGMCLYIQVAKFSNVGGLSVLFVDENGLIFGMKVGDTLKGIPLMLFDAPAPKWNDGSNVTAYTVKFVYKQDFLKSFGFVQLQGGDWDMLNGLQNVVITSGTTTNTDRTAGASSVKVNFSCPGADFYSLYKAQLAVANLWTVKDAVSGNALTVTGVVATDNFGGFVVTIDTADPDYVAGNKQVISLVGAAALNTAGIIAVESNAYTTKN